MHKSQINNFPNRGILDSFDQSELIKSFSGMMFGPLRITLEFSEKFSSIIYTNVRDFQDIYSKNRVDNDIDDPFFETKKKCLPENIDHLPMTERSLVRMKNSYFVTLPLTIEKRDGPSFADKTMNNLIVDTDEKLIQLLYGGSQSSQVRNGQKLMQVIEYIIGSKTIARKFEGYI